MRAVRSSGSISGGGFAWNNKTNSLDVYIDYNAVDAYIHACVTYRAHQALGLANPSADPGLMRKQPLLPHKKHSQLSQSPRTAVII